MTTATGLPDGLEANQQRLSAALDRLRGLLERRVGQSPQADDELQAAPVPPALERLVALFGLSPFERDMLLLCAAVELDARFAPLCAALAGDARQRHATFGLALATLEAPHWSALAPAAPLRHWRLVEVASGEPLTTAAVRIDERVLHDLTGVRYLDDRLAGLIEPVMESDPLPLSHRRIVERLHDVWAAQEPDERRPVAQLCGPDGGGKSAVCSALCARRGLRLFRMRAADVPAAPAERAALARLCERELALSAGVLILDCHGTVSAESQERAVIPFIEEMGGPLVVAAREALALDRVAYLRLEITAPSAAERQHSWRSALGPMADKLNGQLDGLAAQFSLTDRGIRAAGAAASEGAYDDETLVAKLWDACRVQARAKLDELAQRIEGTAQWPDLVLPAAQLQMLREVAIHVRRAGTVYESWGFAGKGARGLGISALFTGASGTGKTMAAEVLANELRLDLYRIDLSQAVSKYIGETEKNLRRIFEAAEQSGAILLFDEADALFGRRSEVKDSHDRYANIEVSYLLQRMETYRGLAVLTTNMKSALDTAFLRRIRFVVQFPFPDAPQRAEIWRGIFPTRTPTEGLDFDRLARLSIAGGNIRCIALNAAFLAAEEGTPVRMSHLLRAAQGEYAKLERSLTVTEIGSWS